MGYNSSVDGRITITPPLTWAEIQTSPVPVGRDHDFDVALDITEDTVDIGEGQLIRKSAAALIPGWNEPYKAYRLVEHVQAAINAHPGHEFTGRFDCEGEEPGDLWRVVIRNRQAVRIEPRIVWPDEDAAN